MLSIENVSKQYQLGVFGTGTIGGDVNRWWHKLIGKEDPYLKIGESNDRASKGSSNFVWALRDINLEIERGEVLGIIGKNGAGKSTLLKLLSRVTAPTTGTIRSKGRIAALLEVGTGFHPELTGKENIFLNGALLGMSKAEIKGKLDEIVEFSGVQRYLDTPVKRYSSGMKVRLGFAVAAHLEPDILVVDEVLAVGDAEFQKKAIGKMKSVSSNEGRTVLFVSHNMGSIQKLCNSLIIMKNGSVDYMGTVKEGIQRYLSTSSKDVTQNLFEREDRIGGKSFRFKTVEIFGGDENNRTTPQTGQKVLIKLTYEAAEVTQNVIVRLLISDSNGNIQFVCNNNHSSEPFEYIHQKGCFICIIPNLPLPSSDYFIHIQCAANRQVVDEVEYAAEFNVAQGDFYGTGKIPKIKAVLVNHSISYEPEI